MFNGNSNFDQCSVDVENKTLTPKKDASLSTTYCIYAETYLALVFYPNNRNMNTCTPYVLKLSATISVQPPMPVTGCYTIKRYIPVVTECHCLIKFLGPNHIILLQHFVTNRLQSINRISINLAKILFSLNNVLHCLPPAHPFKALFVSTRCTVYTHNFNKYMYVGG